MHEVLIAADEARIALEFDDMFVVTPMFLWWAEDRWLNGKPLPEGFKFASETNSQWLSLTELRALIGEVFNG